MAGALNLKPAYFSLSESNPTRPLLSHRPMTITMSQTDSYWASIETHLKKSIPIRPPVSVFEPMHHLTFSTPKTKAAALCIAACELVGGDPSAAIAAASAIHLMNAAAFAHKHLPLTDRPKTNSMPEISHNYNPNIELLTGDGIVPYGIELLARTAGSINDSGLVLRVIIEITRAVGSQGVVDGQYRELECTQSACDVGWVEYACEKKEGELHACGAACGAILGGGSEEEIEKLRRYGLYVGKIQGMLHGVGKNVDRRDEIVERLKGLALKELESFESGKVQAISSFCNA